MNKKSLAIIMLATVSGLSVLSAADAADGTVTFSGNITADSCTVGVNGGTANATVDLGTVAANSFTKAGSVSTVKDFTLNLTACPTGVSNVSVTFDGQSVSSDPSSFQNNDTGSSAATGVGVRLYNNGTSTTQIYPQGTSANFTPTDGNVDMPFSARIVSVASTVTAGSLTATTDYTINYQ